MTMVKELINTKRLIEETDAEQWKLGYVEELQKLEHVLQRSKELAYNRYVKNEPSEEYEMLEAEIHATLSNPVLLEVLKKWEIELTESIWKRRLHAMVREIEETVVDSDPRIVKVRNELQTTLMQKEFEVDGQTFNVATINSSRMELPDHSLRRKLHQEVAGYGIDVSEAFRKLIVARNEVAQEHGYQNYHAFKCEFRGLDFDQYKKECNIILEKTATAWEEWEQRIKERFGWNKVHSADWLYAASHFSNVNHEQFTPSKITEALAEATNRFGVDYQSLPIDVKVLPIPFGGLCMSVSPEDIRMVINERTGNTVYFTAFHEFGHALYNAFSSKQYFELDEYKSTISHEAMAEIFATISSQEQWLKEFWNLEEADINEIMGAQHLFELVLMRIYYYYSLVEEVIYKNPSCDFAEVANDLYQQVTGNEDIGFHPATDLLFLSHPVYVQDYIFADGIRDMLLHALQINGMYDENESFHILKKEFMEPGERYTWFEKAEKICGESFTFSYYGDYLATGVKTK